MQEELINRYVLTLSGKLSIEDIRKVKDTLTIFFINYEAVVKSTELSTVAQENSLLQIYLFTRQVEGLSTNTLHAYKNELELFLNFIHKPVEAIEANDIRYYLYDMSHNRKLKDSTIVNKKAYIGAFFTWLVDNEYLAKNPCHNIKLARREHLEKEPLSGVEMEKLRNACKTVREKAIIEFFYSTACRVSELANVKITDINIEEKTVKLYGKGKKERISYLNARCIVALNEYLSSLSYTPEYLFGNSKGNHGKICRENFEKIVRKLGKRAGITSCVHPHRIRRTSATDAVRKGMKIEECSKWLGHTTIATTQIYVKINNDDVKSSHSKYIN